MKLRPQTKQFISNGVNVTRIAMQYGFVPLVLYLGFSAGSPDPDHPLTIFRTLLLDNVSWLPVWFYIFCFFGLLAGLGLFLWQRTRKRSANFKNWRKGTNIKVCIVLGSGGHTTEMLRFVKNLGPQYNDRMYVLATTDSHSENMLKNVESTKKEGSFRVIKIPRSREVRQSYITSVISTLSSLWCSFIMLLGEKPDLILCNGPGTCIPICFVAFFMDLICIKWSRVVFVESVCRVVTLSLSGEILYWLNIADVILVQWPKLKQKYSDVVYLGRL